MNLNVLYAATSAVNALTSFVLGLFILLRNPRSTLHQLWWWMSLAIAVWATFLSISFGISPYNYSLALFSVRVSDMVAIFIPLLYLHFIVVFLGRMDQQRLLRVCYSVSIILACVAFTPFYISGLRTKLGIVNYNDAGPLFWGFGVLYLWELLYAIHLLSRARRTIVGTRRAQITYVMAGGIVGFLVGAAFFPLCFNIPIPPIGGHVVWLYCLFVAWAVFKHQLFDIHVVIRRSILSAIILAMLTGSYFGLIYAAERLFKMSLLQHHILALTLTAVTSFGLGLLVFFAEPRKRLNQIFGLFSLTISWWAGGEAFVVGARDQLTANLWAYIEWPGVIFIAPTFLHTVYISTGQRRWSAKLTLLVSYLSGMLFLLLHLFTGLISTSPRPVGYAPFHNKLVYCGVLIPLAFVILVSIALWWLWQAYREETGQRKTQMKYLFWASVIGYIGGTPDWFFVFGFYVPFLSPFGIYGVPCYSIATAYAVLHHRLFDVNLVIRRSLVYSLLVTLLTVCYFGLVYAVERLLQVTFGYYSVWGSVTAFAIMALAFQPLKIGIQRLVDWLLFRAPHEEMVRRMERLEQQVRHAEKLEAVSILAAGMAHEIKNPLTSIKTFAAYLPEKAHDPSFQRKFQRIVTQEVDKIDQIVRRLLDFAKPAPPKLQPTHVSQLLDETLEFLSSDCLKKRIQIERSYEPKGTIRADPQQLRQVFLNLLLNSLEAMDGTGGRLSVTTATGHGQLTVAIQDTGPGIPNEHLTRVFDPFFTTKPRGTGLGLSIVQRIITEHHGTITFDNEPDRGTRCMLTFPLNGDPG